MAQKRDLSHFNFILKHLFRFENECVDSTLAYKVIRCFCFNRAIVRSALSFVQKTRSVLPTIKTTLQNANVVMLLDILENHVESIMSNAFITLPLYIDRVRA